MERSPKSLDKQFNVIRQHDKNRSIVFLTANSKTRYEQLRYMGINSVLMSYEYVRKNFSYMQEVMLPEIYEGGGMFMTDSGAFSFFKKQDPILYTKEFWEPYLEEYCSFLYDNAKYIYCAANLDLEGFVGLDVVDEWDEKYFKPLERYMQIVYIVHSMPGDTRGFLRIADLALRGKEYIGIASDNDFKYNLGKYEQLARNYGIRYHGFGFTEYEPLLAFPLFSSDSSTWTMGSRYGETHHDNGRHFVPLNRDFHHTRKIYRNRAEKEMGLTYDSIKERRNRDWDVNVLNLHGWLRFMKNVLESGNRKLTRHKPVISYKVPEKPIILPDFYKPLKDRKIIKL